MQRRVIVPFFISHQGCPHSCIFCDQRRISGAPGLLPSPEEISEKVAAYRSSSRQATVEVAFYGGSFTMLPQELQRSLLSPLQPLRDSGQVSAVRLSTRPDALDPGVIGLLQEFQVSLVELGVQSMDDGVLSAAGRGHTAFDTVRAFTLLQEAGINVGAQLMPGLPGDTFAGSLWSLHRLLALKPVCLRIYPTVVVAGTELAARFFRGEYCPLKLEEAVTLGARLLHAALLAGVPVIRMGLQPTDLLSAPDGVVAGPFHPAFRQLVESELFLELLRLLTAGAVGPITVSAHPSQLSTLVGQRNVNRNRLREEGILLEKFIPEATLALHDLAVTFAGITRKGNIMTDLYSPEPEAHHG